MSSEDVAEVTQADWEKNVEKSGIPVIVMFHSPTCHNCREIEPYFDELAGEFKEKAIFMKLNVLKNPYIAERYGVMGTPTFKFFCSGRPVKEVVGAAYPPLIKKAVEDTIERGSECAARTTSIDYSMSGYA